jgi:hypothetical protein
VWRQLGGSHSQERRREGLHHQFNYSATSSGFQSTNDSWRLTCGWGEEERRGGDDYGEDVTFPLHIGQLLLS